VFTSYTNGEAMKCISFTFRTCLVRAIRTSRAVMDCRAPIEHTLGFCPSALFSLLPSSFILYPSSFILHPSSFILHPSSFILHPSSFSLLPSVFSHSTSKCLLKLARLARESHLYSRDTFYPLLTDYLTTMGLSHSKPYHERERHHRRRHEGSREYFRPSGGYRRPDLIPVYDPRYG
jgi:hypothetical protein